MESPFVERAALEKLQQEILAEINMRHQEVRSFQDAVFEKMRAQVQGTVSRIAVNEQRQQCCPSASCPQHLTKNLPDIVVQDEEPHQQLQPPSKSHMQHHAKSPPDITHSPILPTAQHDENHVNGTCKINRRHPDQVAPTKERGAFVHQPELLAFLQAKNWESDFAHNPDQKKAGDDDAVTSTASPAKQRFNNVITSTSFDLFIGMMIMANSIVMGLELEYRAMDSAAVIGVHPDEGNWPDADAAFAVLEHVFAIFFLVELMLRVSAIGKQYFKQALNWMDILIVAVSVLELYVFALIGAELPNVSFIRVLRIFKMVKALRIVRVLKFFENLRILVTAIVFSLKSFMWSVLLLGIVALIASIFMTQSLQTYLQDETADRDNQKQVYLYFGSWSRSCITIFEMTLAIGTWGRCGRIVIFGVSRYYALFFFGYLALVSFAMIRVIAALFLKDTLASAAKDNEVVMAEVNRDPDYVRNIQRVFREMDTNGDGYVSLNEMHVMLKDEHICAWLQELGIVPRELQGLLELMDDGDDTLEFCEFLAGIMRMKAASKGVDLATLLLENKKILSRVVSVSSQVDQLRTDLGYSKLPSGLHVSSSISSQPRILDLQWQADPQSPTLHKQDQQHSNLPGQVP
eukprot:gnl/MRDRNA2_/MRDRNA2_58171_c0_seq1.p1 gnl/MRDRNA2_/MRDRNA2_58171_c0~~gnl/MRDRNA2_/MRDRNA2_58171_c0_seq1.p1  ORF type:complete len:632 (+),score=131.16 gnl/MRDRNA2_/MRDRNA2_58171_c0_seq1:121-2016(+)